MSNSLIDLRTHMAGKSVCHGWDGVVTMSRAKVNALLEQQYISRFNLDSFLKAINETVTTHADGNELLQLQGVILSRPILSFENANLASSKAMLRMDIVAGAFSRLIDAPGVPRRIVSSFNITPQQQFKVEMEIDLLKAQGNVGKRGRVTLDLAEGYNFTCNLVEDGVSQARLGRFFKELFERQTQDFRSYEFGMFDYVPDTLLAPRNFIIRTQAAPQGRNADSEEYGEGAVVLLVSTLAHPEEGEYPSEATLPYMIPDDRDDEGKPIYSCSLVLSSRAVFDVFVINKLMAAIKNNLLMAAETPSIWKARKFRAQRGGIALAFERKWESYPFPGRTLYHTLSVIDNGFVDFASPQERDAFTVTADDEQGIHIGWRRTLVVPMNHKIERPGWDGNYIHNTQADIDLSVYFTPQIDPLTNKVTFKRRIDSTRFNFEFSNPGEDDRDFQVPYDIRAQINRHAGDELQKLFATVTELTFDELDLFAISHLIFPDQHTLFLSEAYLPGDLFMVGKLDPSLTSISIDPLRSIVGAGSDLQLQIRDQGRTPGAATWSVRAIDGSRSLGTITNGGLFTAPEAGRINGRAARNVVTVSAPGADGETVRASAMVVVATESIGTYPEMFTIDMADPKPVELRAWTLDAGPIVWHLGGQPGTLVPDGDRATYTPPAQSAGIVAIVIEAEDETSKKRAQATVLLLGGTFAVEVAPAFLPMMGTQGQYTFRGPEVYEPGDLKWRIISGQGHIDESTGVYTAPDEVRQPYVVIEAVENTPFFADKGYAVMHLSRYANPSQWTDLSPFKLVLASTSNKLYDNGQQQVAIRVEVQGKNGSQLVEISDDELDSIRLVTARTHQPLRHVGWEGVKVGDKEKWGVNEDYNGFVYHPDSAQDSTPVPRLRERVFYVQTRDINPLDIAAELTDDYLIPHYSDQDGGSEDNETIFKAMPRPSPIFAATNFKFEPLRVEGGSDNDNFLETVDYYELRLVVNEQIVRLVDFEFEGRDSMLRWESKQTDEDVFSYTGYYKPPTPPNNGAEPGPGTLAIDMAMEQRMPFPAPTLINGYVPPPGVIMISLHRGTSWNYDYVNGPQYERPLVLSVTDHFGNKHRLHIDFKALDNRNELVHRVIS